MHLQRSCAERVRTVSVCSATTCSTTVISKAKQAVDATAQSGPLRGRELHAWIGWSHCQRNITHQTSAEVCNIERTCRTLTDNPGHTRTQLSGLTFRISRDRSASAALHHLWPIPNAFTRVSRPPGERSPCSVRKLQGDMCSH